MKIGLISLFALIAFSSCGGGGISSETDCIMNCSTSYSRSSSLCNAKHERMSSDGLACTEQVGKDHDKCMGECYSS